MGVNCRHKIQAFKVFPSMNCQFREAKVTYFGKTVQVLTRQFSAFAIKCL